MGTKSEQTKERILQEAWKLFAKKGYQAVTMTDICEKTGLSRGGLYRYYAGTGEIFSELLSREYVISDRMDRQESAAAILDDMLAEIRGEIMDKEMSLSLAIYEYANLGNEKLFQKINENARRRWISLIRYGKQTGEFLEVDEERVVDCILYYYQGLRLWSRVIPFGKETAERYVEMVREMLRGDAYKDAYRKDVYRKRGCNMTTQEILIQAKESKTALMLADAGRRNTALLKMADALAKPEHMARILEANRRDLEAARGTISDVMLDRLMLDEARIAGMAQGIREVAGLEDPVGKVLSEIVRPNGMTIQKKSVPMGVIAIIYESRPNVTSDAAALAVKSGNACVLRSGKEAWQSCHAIVEAMQVGLEEAGMPRTAVNLIEDTSRVSANELMTAEGFIDLLIPRGGKGLIRSCVEHATVPCIQTGTGICHIYVDEAADLPMALRIVENAKTSRPSVCNAQEVCLVHKDIAARFLPMLREALCSRREEMGAQPVELRLDTDAAAYIDGTAAGEADFDTEFLDYILAVKIVDGVEEAIEHINQHSTGHSEAIITKDPKAAEQFTAAVDSAAVYVNVSTRFTDGGEFGLGCEMGISTQKLHARGPMGLAELCTYKYVICGDGQVR